MQDRGQEIDLGLVRAPVHDGRAQGDVPGVAGDAREYATVFEQLLPQLRVELVEGALVDPPRVAAEADDVQGDLGQALEELRRVDR